LWPNDYIVTVYRASIKNPYDLLLNKKAIPKGVHFYYRKWLRYYLDFCEKYRFNKLNKETLDHFIKKLTDKKQTIQQQNQAYHAISTTKYNLKITNANWMPVYERLTAEIKLRHYSPKTLKSYRSWIRQFQSYPLAGN